MKFYINNVFINLIDGLSNDYAGTKAEGKAGRNFAKTFNAAKTNFTEVAYLLYIKCFKCTGDICRFNGNNINSEVFRVIDRNNYTKILDILASNNIIVINNSYSIERFSKSFMFHHDLLYLIIDSKCKFNYNSTLIDLSSYKHLYKIFQLFPSIYVSHFSNDDVIHEEKFNKSKREYKKTYEDKDMEKTNYQLLTYDETALEDYCVGDELMEHYYRQKLKDLKRNPDIIWNRYYHLFHHLPKDFKTHVLRFNGKSIVEAFDVPGSDMHMFAKLIENYDIPARELERFQRDVKSDFRTLFGKCKRTGKAKSYVKTAFKKYMFAKSDFYNNLRIGSVCWHIDQHFQEHYPAIRQLLIDWQELKLNNKETKSLWADAMLMEFETISVRMTNLLMQKKHMPCLTCHDAIYLTEDDAERISEAELRDLFYTALDLYVDKQDNFYNL
jgi:hypothetical protein